MNKELIYETPQVEIIEVEVEQGFSVSDPSMSGPDFEMG